MRLGFPLFSDGGLYNDGRGTVQCPLYSEAIHFCPQSVRDFADAGLGGGRVVAVALRREPAGRPCGCAYDFANGIECVNRGAGPVFVSGMQDQASLLV